MAETAGRNRYGRFVRGQSGNPKGRPRIEPGNQTELEVVQHIFFREAAVTAQQREYEQLYQDDLPKFMRLRAKLLAGQK